MEYYDLSPEHQKEFNRKFMLAYQREQDPTKKLIMGVFLGVYAELE